MKKLIALILMIAAAIAVPAVLLAWGPSRQPLTGAASHIVFNSIEDNPAYGDERNFMKVRDANSGEETYADNISLTAGHEYVVYIYYHNDASSTLNDLGLGVATGAYVKAEMPGVVSNGASNVKAMGYVGATNADPTLVWDDISFNNTTGGDIALRYIPKSATIHSFGPVDGKIMSDNIVTTGAPIGYQDTDGFLPGCDDFAGYVTFKMKADQPSFTITKRVQKVGATNWDQYITVNPDDTIDYQITYRNNGTTDQDNVLIKDILPNDISYVEGTTYLKNGNNPKGMLYNNNITKNGINIGNYYPGAVAYIKFTAKVASNKDLDVCGANILRNTVIAENENGVESDIAEVTVNKVCQPPVNPPKECKPGIPEGDARCIDKPVAPKECKPGIPEGDARCKETTPEKLPVTGAGENIAAFLGFGAIATSISYYIASRRSLVKK